MENEILKQLLETQKAMSLSQELMFSELKNINNRFDNLEAKVDNLETKFDALEAKVDNLETKFDALEAKVDNLEHEVQHIKQISLRMEDEHGKKLQTLFDAFTVNRDKNEEHEPRISKLEAIVQHHSLEILALKNK